MEGIPIENFEDYIDEIVLQRGENYARSDAVIITKRTKNSILANCTGTNLYEVNLRISEGQIMTYECTCPFEYGPICKHIAAVLYVVRDGLDLSEREFALSSENIGTAWDKDLNTAIDNLDHRDLKKLVRKWTNNYMKLEKELIEYYRQKLKKIK